MARSRAFRLWTVALWALCILAATGGHTGSDSAAATSAGTPTEVSGVIAAAADPAVLPARIAGDVRVATQTSPPRLLVLAAVLTVLAGLPALLWRRIPAAGRDQRALRSRRYAIALRAPPLQFA